MDNPIELEKQLLAIAREQGFTGTDLRVNRLLMRCMIAVWEVNNPPKEVNDGY